MRWSKWSFWLLHTLAFSLVYLGLLLLPMTRWRDALPAKPAFYRSVAPLACPSAPRLNRRRRRTARPLPARAGTCRCCWRST